MEIHGERMPNHRDSKFIGDHLGVTYMEILLSPIPNLSAGNLPFFGVKAIGRSTRMTFERVSRRQKIRVSTGKSKLSDVHGKPQGDVETEQLLQSISITFNFEYSLIQVRNTQDFLAAKSMCALAKIVGEHIHRQTCRQ